MKLVRVSLRVLLVLVLLFDVVNGYRMWDLGWRKYVSTTSSGEIFVGRIPFTATDWFVVAAIVAFHIVLIYFVWRTRRSASVGH
jgi:hypothetical protein